MATASESTPGLPDERDRLVRMGVNAALGITAAFFAVVVLRADQHAEFAFDDAVVLVGVFHDSFADFDVFLERLVAAVNHHAGETFVNALLAQLERVAVVQMHGNGDVGQADRRPRSVS